MVISSYFRNSVSIYGCYFYFCNIDLLGKLWKYKVLVFNLSSFSISVDGNFHKSDSVF